jgi:tetratricopeptide (TPR) repeat protein
MWGNFLKAVGQAMAEQLTQAAEQQQTLLATQQAQFAHRQFVASLFVGDEASAIARLRAHVQALDDANYGVFQQTAQMMLLEAQQNLAQVQASGGDTAWGTSFEDRMALGMAQIRTGDYSSSQQMIQQAQQAVMGLSRVVQLSQQFRTEMQQPAAARPAAAPASGPSSGRQARAKKPGRQRAGRGSAVQSTTASASAEDETRINAMLDQLMATGQMPDGLMQALTNAGDPALLERVMQKLKDAGADQLGDRPLDNIADYYREGDDLYDLLWPIATSLPMPFGELDRPTQFHVLFAECRRRHTEASAARNAGRLDEADAAFRECLERADQIDVPILKADAYEGLMTVAEKRGDREQARRYLQMAERERSRQAERRK